MTPPSELNQKLQELWQRYLPQMLARWELIHSAIEALSRGNLSDGLRNEAAQAAHKLAGSLGTFGLQQGTQAAQEIERLLSEKATPAKVCSELERNLGYLKQAIEQR
jgi:HPt (histidine-containing phosphotransfer) domain-containing protein